ncbi:hypothetical protein [Sulfurimonas sp. NWX367]|uniref:hypothetical protein n=1 Tax=Sulfurimonas sp. NWX367 TaxID=2925413 RepID=UPI003204DF4E
MRLVFDYFKFNTSAPVDFTLFDDMSYLVYMVEDDGTYTFIATDYADKTSQLNMTFSVPNDTNTYLISDSGGYVSLFCSDSNGAPASFPYDFSIGSSFFEFYYSEPVFDVSSSISDAVTTLSDLVTTRANGVLSTIQTSESNILNNVGSRFDSVDISLSGLSTSFSDFQNSLVSLSDSVSGVQSSVDAIPGSISTVDFNSFSFSSLNGASGSFKDGQAVTIDGVDGIYTVESSQMLKNDANVYLIIYKVVRDGMSGVFPSNMVHLSTGV